MNIPHELHVGFNNRTDTYTGKLAFITYIDEKGKFRKEKNWENWRDKSIPSEIHKNEPISGFVINRNGGGRGYSSWNSRNEFVRVYDPRGFEVEISISNLLFILQECTSTKGKGLDGEFVYGIDRRITLIPTSCKEYKESLEYTSLKTKKITKNDMVAGRTYCSKTDDKLVYIGRYNTRFTNSYQYREDPRTEKMRKKHIFYNLISKQYVFQTGFTKLAEIIDTDVYSDFTKLHQRLMNSKHCSTYLGLKLIECDDVLPKYQHSRLVVASIPKPNNTFDVTLITICDGQSLRSYLNMYDFVNVNNCEDNPELIDSICKQYMESRQNVYNYRLFSKLEILDKYPNTKFYTLNHIYESGLTSEVKYIK